MFEIIESFKEDSNKSLVMIISEYVKSVLIKNLVDLT